MLYGDAMGVGKDEWNQRFLDPRGSDDEPRRREETKVYHERKNIEPSMRPRSHHLTLYGTEKDVGQ